MGSSALLIERGVPAEKVHVVYNWADDDVFMPCPETMRRGQLGMSGKFNIVYAGNMGGFRRSKRSSGRPFAFEICRRSRLSSSAQAKAKRSSKRLAGELGADNVRFVGRRRQRHAQNQCAVRCSARAAQGLSVLRRNGPQQDSSLAGERSAGVHAVRGDAAKIIERANAGMTCAPENEEALANAMRQLYATPRAELEAMGERGRRFYLEHMSLDVGGRLTEAVLEQVASPHVAVVQRPSAAL